MYAWLSVLRGMEVCIVVLSGVCYSYHILDKSSGPNSIIKDLPSVLILIIADQLLNDSLCCSDKYK